MYVVAHRERDALPQSIASDAEWHKTEKTNAKKPQQQAKTMATTTTIIVQNRLILHDRTRQRDCTERIIMKREVGVGDSALHW